MPDAGSQPSHKAKITISTIPSQKLGMLAPKSDASALSRSSSELRRAADSTPSAMPPSVESSRALAARTTVAWKRRSTSPSTGRFIQSERPRSPCSTRPIQRAYCTGSGSSRPSSVRSRVMSSWVAYGPSMISAGRPGEMWRTAKTTSDTPSRTGPTRRSRRRRKSATPLGLLERDRLHAQVEARMEPEALDPLRVGGRLHLVVDEDPRRIVVQDALRLAVHLGTFGLIGDGSRLAQQLVEARVPVHGAVRPVRRPLARVEQRIHHQVGILGAGHPREREHLLLLRAQLGQERAPLHRLQRDVDADRFQVRLDHRRHRDGRLHPRARLGHPQRRRETSRIAGLGQELLRALGIVRERLEAGLVTPRARQHRSLGRSAGALEHVAHDRVLVDGVVQRLPHALVGERLLLVVEAQVPDVRAHLLEQRELGVALELGDEVRRHAYDEVEAPGEQLGEPGLVLDDRAVDDAIDLHRELPVRRVLLEHDALATLPGSEAEGPGADGIRAVVEAELLHRRRADDGRGRRGHHVEERSPGTICVLPSANATSVSATRRPTRFELRSVTCAGSSATGSATRPTTSVPAGCATTTVGTSSTNSSAAINLILGLLDVRSRRQRTPGTVEPPNQPPARNRYT